MTVNLNLLPWREILKAERKQRFLAVMAGSGLLAVFFVLLIHFVFSRQVDFQNQCNAYLQQEITLLEKQMIEIEGLQKKKEKLMDRIGVIQGLQRNRSHIVRLLDVLVRTVPDGLYLVSLTRADGRLFIEGRAESNSRVSSFMRNMEASPWLHLPVLSTIQADNPAEKKQRGTVATEFSERMIDFSMQVYEQQDDQSHEQQHEPVTPSRS